MAALTLVVASAGVGCGSSDQPADEAPAPGPSAASAVGPSSSPSASAAAGSPSAADSPGPSASVEASTPSPPPAPVVITIKDFSYQGPGSVPAGATITVKNEDKVAHSVTADSGNAFDVTIGAGKSATLKAPDRAGDYPYHCKFHSNMEAKLTVR